MSYEKARTARGDTGPVRQTRPHLSSWREARDVNAVKALSPIASRSAEWLALQLSIAFKQQLNLGHAKDNVVVYLPQRAEFWEHTDRAVVILREKGYVVKMLTRITIAFDATKATK
jgi:hypothetical protein